MSLISNIYHKIICNNGEFSAESEVVDEVVCELLEKCKEQMVLEDKESVEELLYSLVLASEEQGFLLGLKFCLALMEEIHLEH